MGWVIKCGLGFVMQRWVSHAGVEVGHTDQTMFPDTPTHLSITPVMSCDVM